MHTQWTLPNFFFLWFAPYFTFLHSKLWSYTLWNHFFLLSGLVPLAGRILGGLEKTTS